MKYLISNLSASLQALIRSMLGLLQCLNKAGTWLILCLPLSCISCFLLDIPGVYLANNKEFNPSLYIQLALFVLVLVYGLRYSPSLVITPYGTS